MIMKVREDELSSVQECLLWEILQELKALNKER